MAFKGFKEYLTAKYDKRQSQNNELFAANLSATSNIFNNLTFWINGFTGDNLSVLDLRELCVMNGAVVADLDSKKVNFHLGTCLPDSKIHTLKKPMINPQWIVDCVKQQKLLPWNNYRVVAAPANQNVLDSFFAPIPTDTNSNFEGATVDKPEFEEEEFDFNDEFVDSIAKGDVKPLEDQNEAEGESEETSWFGPPVNINMNSNWVKQNVSTAPGFLDRFYQQSRLHKLSTWKNELKQYVLETHHPPPIPPAAKNPPIIMHIDLDCFFCSVSLLKHPHLVDKPVCVAHSPGVSGKSTSDIASCNYIARSFGIKNGMSIGRARTLCKELNVINYEFDMYVEASKGFFDILMEFGDRVEVISCDEAYIDVSSRLSGLTPVQLATSIRKQIRSRIGISASIGISHNLLLARISTSKAKPDGIYYCNSNEINPVQFLKDVGVRDLPGVGYVLKNKLEERGIKTCGDLVSISKTELQKTHGPKTGTMLYNYCRGIDDRVLSKSPVRRSVGTDVNWGIRFDDVDQVIQFLKQLANEVSTRLENVRVEGKMVTLKVKKKECDGEPEKVLGHGRCENFSKSIQLASKTKDPEIIFRESSKLFNQLKIAPEDVRGLGIMLTKLEPIDGDQQPEVTSNGMRDLRSHFAQTSTKFDPPIQPLPPPPPSPQKRIPSSPSRERISSTPPTTPQKRKQIIDPTTPPISDYFQRSPSPNPKRQVNFEEETDDEDERKLEPPTSPSPRRGRINGINLTQDFMPTMSQADPAVLAALPESIRKELNIQWNVKKSTQKFNFGEKVVKKRKFTSLKERLVVEQLKSKSRVVEGVKIFAEETFGKGGGREKNAQEDGLEFPVNLKKEEKLTVDDVLDFVIPEWIEKSFSLDAEGDEDRIPDENEQQVMLEYVLELARDLKLDLAVRAVKELRNRVMDFVEGAANCNQLENVVAGWMEFVDKLENELKMFVYNHYGSQLSL
ncbi:deoxycytidyl transferase [Nowakowskiella sp. JEL0407]|nr:deoxycytidyl transferase [Nowakowskiella sp. JEL0407]